MTRLIALLFTVILLNPAQAQTPLETSLQTAFDADELRGLHGVLVIHQGEVLGEIYFDGHDQRWGQSLGIRNHGVDTLHDVRSVSKSVTGLLYGIALDQGIVPDLGEKLYPHFPQYPDLASDPARQGILIRHVLSMTMGTDWNENIPYTSPKNSEIAMENAADRYRYVLEQKVVSTPGEQFNYSGGTTALLGHLIERGSGMTLDAYAEKVLFTPLGIDNFDWVRGPDGTVAAASGLRLSLRSMARIGELISAGGRWEGQQVVSEEWLEAIMTPEANHPVGLRYGLHWWLSSPDFPSFWVAAFGNGGQRLTIQRQFGLVIAVQAGNYNQNGDWRIPVKVIEDHVVPVLRARSNR
ncbi:MAG: serine hydrolase domain-containing protein [Sedimentitalea sp.]